MAQSVQVKDRTSNANLSINSDGSINSVVSGTVTATPTGTQAVSGVLSTYPAISPAFAGIYVFNLPDQPGVAAANNFLSIFNPVGSGKTIAILGGSISTYVASMSSTARISCQALRSTAASGGTLQVNSTALCKFQTSFPASIAEVRTAGPTVTLGAAFLASPPPINPNTGDYVYQIQDTPGAGALMLVPGEGIVLRTTAGDTHQTWNFNVVWGEI